MKNYLSYKDFVIVIPLISAMVTIINFYIGDESIHFGIVVAIYMFFVVWAFVISQLKYGKPDIYIYMFLLYLFLLLPLSSNPKISLIAYVKVFLCLMMVPVAHYYINSKKRFLKVINIYLLSAILIVIFFFYSQVAGIGTRAYSASSILLPRGDQGVYLANLLAYTSIILLFWFSIEKTKFKTMISLGIYVSLIIVVLLIFRRSAILAMIVGNLVFLTFSTYKKRYVRYILAVAILLAIILPKYLTEIKTVSKYRPFLEMTDPDFNRTKDIIKAYQDITRLGGLHLLFGTELFNDMEYFHSRRPMHSDFGKILHGAGFFGLIFFMIIHIAMANSFKSKKNKEGKSDLKQNLAALGYGLIVATLIISSANQLWAVGSLTNVMFMIGSIYGFMDSINLGTK